jgi:hypothetical protein
MNTKQENFCVVGRKKKIRGVMGIEKREKVADKEGIW